MDDYLNKLCRRRRLEHGNKGNQVSDVSLARTMLRPYGLARKGQRTTLSLTGATWGSAYVARGPHVSGDAYFEDRCRLQQTRSQGEGPAAKSFKGGKPLRQV